MSTGDEHLVRMANDIAANTRAGKTEAEAMEAIANHMRRFWSPKMRQRYREICRASPPAGLAPDALGAAERLPAD